MEKESMIGFLDRQSPPYDLTVGGGSFVIKNHGPGILQVNFKGTAGHVLGVGQIRVYNTSILNEVALALDSADKPCVYEIG
jgi:hypothetical protein